MKVMKNITPNDELLAQNESIENLKSWKKPILIQLDIKQTLTVGDDSRCPNGVNLKTGECL